MRTPQDDKGRRGGMGWMGSVMVFFAMTFFSSPAVPAPPAFPAPPASPALPTPQIPFETAAKDLSNADPGVRLRAARLLKEAAYVEAAIPLVPLVNDPEDAVQLEAIAAELNIFLAEKIVTRRRVGLVIEVRKKIAAEAAFSVGPLALSARRVPIDVLTALRTVSHDENPQVAIEALYAFGVLSADAGGPARRELLRASGPDLAALLGASDPELRLAALRVIARVFARQPQDAPADEVVGDAVIVALNESDRNTRAAAMDALGAMRYERAVTALTQLFEYYGRNELGLAAFDALARIGHPASAPVFTAKLTGRNAALKVAAIEGLGRIGDRTIGVGILAALSGERNEAVQLAGAFASVLILNGRMDALAEALGRPRLHDQAMFYLAELAAGRTSELARYAQDPDPRLRTDLADLLALSGDHAALAIVEPMTRDVDPNVSRAAARAVARLKL